MSIPIDAADALNLGVYPEHPKSGRFVFSSNGVIYFGGATYKRSDGGVFAADQSDLVDRVAALETRADALNATTSQALQDAAAAKGHAQAALIRADGAENAIDRLQDRIVELEDGPDAEDEDDTPLVENVPRPRFFEDDRVVYTSPAEFYGKPGKEAASRPDGTLGTVLEDSNGAPGARVQWENDSIPTMTSIEFVQPAPPTTKFLVGDVVEIGQSIYGTVEPGTWGIVRSIIPDAFGGWVYSVKMPYRSFLFNESEIRGKVS